MARRRVHPSGTGQCLAARSLLSKLIKGQEKGRVFFAKSLIWQDALRSPWGPMDPKVFTPVRDVRLEGIQLLIRENSRACPILVFFRITAQVVLFEGAEHETNSVEFAASLTGTPIGMRGLVSIRIDRDYHCVECAGVKGWVELTPRRNAHSSIAAIPSIRYGYRG